MSARERRAASRRAVSAGGIAELDGRGETRRAFLRKAGMTGALAVAPGVMAACGGGGGGGGGGGETIKIGYVTPSTGSLADFAAADDFIFGEVEKAWKGGVETQEGKRQVEIIKKDSQSSADVAGKVASDLILNEGVHLMLVASTPETTNPVSDQCELNGVPCISTVAPWQSWFFGRGAKENTVYEWTYHFFWGLEDLIAEYLDIWGQISTNKVVAALWPNDEDGNAFANRETGIPPALKENGYTLVDPGRYEDLTNDYSAQIAEFKSANAEILTGVPLPPDFTKFYTQAAQQGYRPKIATVAKAVLFPAAVDALGPLGENVTTEVWWSPNHPFSSSLTHMTSKQLADAYTAALNKQWTQPLGYSLALFDVANDVLKRASSPTDKKAIAEAIKDSSVKTIVGTVSWKNGPVPNVAKTPLVGGQWVKGDRFPYDLVIVSNVTAPNIPKQASPVPIT